MAPGKFHMDLFICSQLVTLEEWYFIKEILEDNYNEKEWIGNATGTQKLRLSN